MGVLLAIVARVMLDAPKQIGRVGHGPGNKGKRALVCASSKGLGLGCAQALAEAGVDLVMNARGSEALEASAAAIREAYGVSVETVATDVTTPEGQAQVIAAADGVDILVNNAGGPPPGMWTDWDREDFIKALDANMLTPITFMKALGAGHDGAWLGPGGEHHLAKCEGAHSSAGAVEFGARRADGICGRNCAASCRERREYQ